MFEGTHLVVEERGHRASTPVDYMRADLTFSLRRISIQLLAGKVPEPRIALLYANAILPPPQLEAIRDFLNNPQP